MAKTNLAVFSNGTGDTESLKTDTDSGSSISSLFAALLNSNSATYSVSPLCILKADRLSFFNNFVRVDTVSIANVLTLINRVNSKFLKSSKNLRKS